jgi:poly-beta-1,6-N-acetyl-D-glucosamine synthase
MLLSILFYVFIIVGIVHLIHFAMFLVGANVYDILIYKSKSALKKMGTSYQPLVSILIPAYNEESVIERCLSSVCSSTYPNIQILVVSDGSTDKTAEVVRRFIDDRIATYRPAETKLVRSGYGFRRTWQRSTSPASHRIKIIEQANGGKASALNRALLGQTQGELVMTLDADSVLHRKAIENVIKYFLDPTVAGVAANVRIIEKRTLLGILQRFEHMVGYRSKKFFSVVNAELIVGGVASTYRRSVLEAVGFYDTDTVTEDIGLSMKIAAMGNKKYKLVYGYDVAAMTEGVGDLPALLRQRFRWKMGNLQNLIKYREILLATDSRFSKSLSFYRMPMAFFGEVLLLLEPVSLGYVLFLSIKFLSPALILGAYMTITVYLLLTIWPDEHMTVQGKLKASLYTPLLYFIFYIMNAVQLISIIRCLVNHKTITGRSAGHTTWISPHRTGGLASFN